MLILAKEYPLWYHLLGSRSMNTRSRGGWIDLLLLKAIQKIIIAEFKVLSANIVENTRFTWLNLLTRFKHEIKLNDQHQQQLSLIACYPLGNTTCHLLIHSFLADTQLQQLIHSFTLFKSSTHARLNNCWQIAWYKLRNKNENKAKRIKYRLSLEKLDLWEINLNL